MVDELKSAKHSWWKIPIGFAIFIMLFVMWWGIPNFQVWRADQQVKELCAKDGGVKLYEAVSLPSEMFNQWGQINFYRPVLKENALGPDYLFKRQMKQFKRGSPNLFQIHTQVIRRVDGKLLGESSIYIRRGGGPIGPWHESSYMCPEMSEKEDVLRQVFISGKRVNP